jgi:16S rRNA processing protein RimM
LSLQNFLPTLSKSGALQMLGASKAGSRSCPIALLRKKIKEAKDHSDSVVATSAEVPDRNTAELLKGARIFVSRASFPTPETDEYYWVDLIGLDVVNREGVVLGAVRELLHTGPQTVLVLAYQEEGKAKERMIPFVSAYIDTVDLAGRRITADWQPDY